MAIAARVSESDRDILERLDDVAPEATKVAKPPKPPYTVHGHIAALEKCRKAHMEGWLAKFLANPRSDEDGAQAFAAFKAKCLLEGLDGDELIANAM